MSNRVIVKFGFIVAMFVFASCTSEVPELPSPDEVKNFKFCKYKYKTESGDYDYKCKSTYEISETECKNVGGELFPTMASCNK